MIPRILACFMLVAVAVVIVSDQLPAKSQMQPPKNDERVKVSVCQLKKDPAAYNHKLVEVTGFISHGFEDFTISDPACLSWPDIWLEYGGTRASDTMYCCGVVPSHTRPAPLKIDNIQVDFVPDKQMQQFKSLVNESDTIVHATIVGRYFSGEKNSGPRGDRFGGYGHMGCCTLLAIQQVLSVDPHSSPLLDYSAAVYPRGL